MSHTSAAILSTFTPDDAEDVAAWAAVRTAADAVDAPWEPALTPRRAAGWLRHGWDGEVDTPYLLRAAGEPVAAGAVSTSEYDNLHLAYVRVQVAPSHRRRGHGSRLLEALLDEVRRRGRTTAVVEGWIAPSAEAFAARHGFEPALRDARRRQHLDRLHLDRIRALRDEAAEHAVDYRLEHWPVPTPSERLEELAALTAVMNDAPLDGLDYEDEVVTAERVRGYEDAVAGHGDRLHRLVARHRVSGELAGQTIVAVDAEHPEHAEQHDTVVAGAHRGHRLGLLLKAAMVLHLADAEPRLRAIDTWNAASNVPMLAVNELLGYRLLGEQWSYQRHL
ncbi:GNAT family N-acetyltransferase [Nocardioides sp.]|uniref:GNAT family N-acetyltransferase n=1 Tax=Nocardioides sp. TaxID=35761 RepID=UPI003517D516